MVNPNFDWNQFEGTESQEQEEQTPELMQQFQSDVSSTENEIEHPEQPSFEWGDYQDPETYQGEPDPTEEEGTFEYLVRNITQNSSRLGEQYFGRHGNLEKFGKDILSNFPESGGLLGYGLQKLMGQERWERMVRGKPGQQQILPTSEQLKELSEKVTAGYTKPKTKGEEHFQKYIEDIGSTLDPRRQFNLRNIAVNNLGIPIAANVVGDVIENLGFGKSKGIIGKLGTWLGLSLLGNVNAPEYASDLMNQGRTGIPQNINFNTPRILNRLDQVESNLLSADPRTALAREQIANIRRDISNGQRSVRSLMTTYDGTNAAKRSRNLFDYNTNDRNFARGSIDRVLHAVRDEVLDAGSNYPQALESWRNGIQAWAVIHQSRAITNTVDRWAKGPYAKVISGPAAALFGVGTYAGVKTPLASIPLATAVPIAYKAGQTAYRSWEDPRLAQYYWNAISDAQAENAPAFIKNYIELNKGLEKSSGTSKKNKKKS